MNLNINYLELAEEKEIEIVESYLLEECPEDYGCKDEFIKLVEKTTLDDVPKEFITKWINQYLEGERK